MKSIYFFYIDLLLEGDHVYRTLTDFLASLLLLLFRIPIGNKERV